MKIKNRLKSYFKLLLIIFIIVYIGKLYFYNNYCINITPSIPKGIYKLKDIEKLERDKIVYIEIPGDTIQVKNGNNLYINGELRGNIRKYDLQGKKLDSELPIDYVLKEDEYILLGSDDNSYDSRYFGIIKKDKILKEATKINFSYVTRVKH